MGIDFELWAWDPTICIFHTFKGYQLIYSESRNPKAPERWPQEPGQTKGELDFWGSPISVSTGSAYLQRRLLLLRHCSLERSGAWRGRGAQDADPVTQVQLFLRERMLLEGFSLMLSFRIMPPTHTFFILLKFLISPNQAC